MPCGQKKCLGTSSLLMAELPVSSSYWLYSLGHCVICLSWFRLYLRLLLQCFLQALRAEVTQSSGFYPIYSPLLAHTLHSFNYLLYSNDDSQLYFQSRLPCASLTFILLDISIWMFHIYHKPIMPPIIFIFPCTPVTSSPLGYWYPFKSPNLGVW